MPSIGVHTMILERNQKTLDRLLALRPVEGVDDPWILTISYYRVLHRIELAADKIDTHGFRLRTHADRIEFLESRSVRAKQYFHKLHLLSEFCRYGESSDAVIIRRAVYVMQNNDFRQVVDSWTGIIEESLP